MQQAQAGATRVRRAGLDGRLLRTTLAPRGTAHGIEPKGTSRSSATAIQAASSAMASKPARSGPTSSEDVITCSAAPARRILLQLPGVSALGWK